MIRQSFFAIAVLLLAELPTTGLAQSESKGYDVFAPTSKIAADEKPDGSTQGGVVQPIEKTRVKRFPPNAFSGYKPSFRIMCKWIKEDGRLDAFNLMIGNNIDSIPTCRACKTLFKAIYASCQQKIEKELKKTKKVKLEPTEEPNPENSPAESGCKEGEDCSEVNTAKKEEVVENIEGKIPQREPHTAVIDQVSRSFADIGYGPYGNDVLPGVDKLLTEMREKSDKTTAEKEYFSILATYIDSSFKQLRAANEKAQAREEGRAAQSADTLFDY